jgi:hypothetical protein
MSSHPLAHDEVIATSAAARRTMAAILDEFIHSL